MAEIVTKHIQAVAISHLPTTNPALAEAIHQIGQTQTLLLEPGA